MKSILANYLPDYLMNLHSRESILSYYPNNLQTFIISATLGTNLMLEVLYYLEKASLWLYMVISIPLFHCAGIKEVQQEPRLQKKSWKTFSGTCPINIRKPLKFSPKNVRIVMSSVPTAIPSDLETVQKAKMKLYGHYTWIITQASFCWCWHWWRRQDCWSVLIGDESDIS